MATHDGLNWDPMEMEEWTALRSAGVPGFPLEDREINGTAEWGAGSVVSTTHNMDGIFAESFADSHIYHRIWLVRTLIEAGLIASDQRWATSVWNAYRDQSITLTALNGYNELSGITLEGIGTLPIVLPPTGEEGFILVITTQGNPTLDGYYEWTFTGAGGGTRTQDITGIRLIFLPLHHNWDSQFEIEYKYNTMIASSLSLYEQRGPLYSQIRRKARVQGWASSSSFLRNVSSLSSRVLGTAIFSEPMTFNMTGSLSGFTSLTIHEDVSYYYNLLNLTSFLVIYNTVKDKPLLVGYSGRSGYSIILDSPLTVSWNAEDCILYPIMAGLSSSLNLEELTTDVARLEFEMDEYRQGA